MSWFSRHEATEAVEPSEGTEQLSAYQRVERLMQDGEWHSAVEICGVSRSSDGLRRLRDMRSRGYDVERSRIGDSRAFKYRAAKKPGVVR